MARTILFLLGALGLLCAATAPGGIITKFTRTKINVYKEDLTFQGREDPWPVPIKVEDSSKPGFLGVRHGGVLVYVRLSEVIAEGLPQAPCLAAAAAADGSIRSHLAGSTGIGSGLGNGGAPCITQ